MRERPCLSFVLNLFGVQNLRFRIKNKSYGMDYKVLIIEDDEYNRLLYGEVLSGKSCDLFFAEDDVSGFAQYQQIKPDLILLDLRFGEKEAGLDLFSKIRKIDPSVESS